MPILHFRISDVNEGNSWVGRFNVPGDDFNTLIQSNLPSLFGIGPPTASIATYFVSQFDFSTSYNYSTWRTANLSGFPSGPPLFRDRFPRTGVSFDIWSSGLVTQINDIGFWASIVNRTFLLNPQKNTLIYDYDTRTAIRYSRGGTIEFSSSVFPP